MAFMNFEGDDIVSGNILTGVTSTAFSNSSGSLTAWHTHSTQTSSAAGTYHWDLYDLNSSNTAAEVQFGIAYGHRLGSGSARQTGASTGIAPTKAVYSQFRNLLLDDSAETTQFGFGDNTFSDRMYFITMNRARYKQGVNAGNWEFHLSSSAGHHTASVVKVIDDSSTSNGNTINGHLVYNIVSGSEDDGVYTDGSSNNHYWGKFYPELGIFALNGDRVISGSGAPGAITHGLDLNGKVATTANNGLTSNGYDQMNGRLYDAINRGKYFALRAEEDVTSTHYFVRAKNQHFNYSTNPTYQSGSNGQLRHTMFIGNPQTYITTIGLYDDGNNLIAVAKLSKPLLKNFERETTVRVKLDY